MTDEELGAELAPDNPVEGAKLAALMAQKNPAKRAAMVTLVETARALQLWEAGLGPLPPGLLIDRDRRRRKAPAHD